MKAHQNLQNEKLVINGIEISPTEILTNILEVHFKDGNSAILNKIFQFLGVENADQLFERILTVVISKIDPKTLNHSEIEQLDFFSIAEEIPAQFEVNEGIDMSEVDLQVLQKIYRDFAYVVLHKVAFPMMLFENPNIAVSAKNLIKRTIASIDLGDNPDFSKIFGELDLEELPTEITPELIFKLGGTIPGIVGPQKVATDEQVDVFDAILYCELTPEQAIYLSYTLAEDYAIFKNWKQFYNILKPNGKKYSNVIVASNKIGLLLWVISELRARKTPTRTPYLSIKKGIGMWDFFQRFLIDSRTDEIFKRELRKLKSENDFQEAANQIVSELLTPSKQKIITQRAVEITKNQKI